MLSSLLDYLKKYLVATEKYDSPLYDIFCNLLLLLPVTPKYSSKHPVLRHPQVMFFPHTHKKSVLGLIRHWRKSMSNPMLARIHTTPDILKLKQTRQYPQRLTLMTCCSVVAGFWVLNSFQEHHWRCEHLKCAFPKCIQHSYKRSPYLCDGFTIQTPEKENRISKFTICSAQLLRLDREIFFGLSLNPT
jgi:hypothetical protein